MNSNYSTMNFTSTRISSKDVMKAAKVLNPYFKVKGFNAMKPQAMRNKINLSQAGVGLGRNEADIVGKDREADEFIARMIKKSNIEHKYTQDTPETIFESPIFDTTI